MLQTTWKNYHRTENCCFHSLLMPVVSYQTFSLVLCKQRKTCHMLQCTRLLGGGMAGFQSSLSPGMWNIPFVISRVLKYSYTSLHKMNLPGNPALVLQVTWRPWCEAITLHGNICWHYNYYCFARIHVVPAISMSEMCAVYDMVNGTLQIIENSWSEVVCKHVLVKSAHKLAIICPSPFWTVVWV